MVIVALKAAVVDNSFRSGFEFSLLLFLLVSQEGLVHLLVLDEDSDLVLELLAELEANGKENKCLTQPGNRCLCRN